MPPHPVIGCNRQKRHQPQIHGDVNSTMLVTEFLSGKWTAVFSWCSTTLWAIRTSVVSYDMRTCVALFTIQVRLKIMTLYSIWCCWVPAQITARKVDVVWCLSMWLDFTLVNCSVLGCNNCWTFMRVFFWLPILTRTAPFHQIEFSPTRFWANSRVNHLEIEKSNTEHAGTQPRNDMSFHFFQDAVATRWPGLTIQ